MPITFDPKNRLFHLAADHTSYVMKAYPSGVLGQLYWGSRLDGRHLEQLVGLADRRLPPSADIQKADFLGNLDLCPQEYPAHGTSDFRVPAVQVRQHNGAMVSELRYKEHRVTPGKPALSGLPATWSQTGDGAETLEVTLADALTGLEAVLAYTVFPCHDAIVRSVRFANSGRETLSLERALSMAVDLPGGDYRELHLSGSWARERDLKMSPVLQGSHVIESTRGISSHQQNPFLALLRPGADEDHGEVYGFNLVYSGNFLIQVEADQFDWTRVAMGINPFEFSWLLEPGESFQTPEAVMVHSAEGLGGMSRRFHRLYRERLIRGDWATKDRPVLINNWEGTYFDFTAERIEAIAAAAAPLGVELFVLDDGWFGHRDKDSSSLGDWFVDQRKLPQGIDGLARNINKMGLQFGLWFEPEMISPDSELYRTHPDWCLHVPGRPRTELRNQLVLDLTRAEVQDHIIAQVSAIIESAPISYVKWDMNRPLTEVWSAALPAARQGETAHRWMLGVYRMMEVVTARFPSVLFEGCSGGGARFDPGILYYMPQIWTSDDTDAVERLKIQHATSLAYPPSTMGSHVSAVPNHQTGRLVPLETRGHVAMAGVFGYELDATKFTDEEKSVVKAQVELVKATRHLVMGGEYYRLIAPWGSNETAWMFVAPDGSEAMATWVRVLCPPNPAQRRLRLKGLDPAAEYRIDGPDGVQTISGDLLMQAGLRIPSMWGDFKSFLWRLTRV
jgi:alpha-galactosidase